MQPSGADDDFELTIEDVKLGRKLAQIDQFNKKNLNPKEAKLDYYKNLKPHAANFKMQLMDPNQEIIQKAHEKNKAYLESNKYRKLIAPKARQLTEEEKQEEL